MATITILSTIYDFTNSAHLHTLDSSIVWSLVRLVCGALHTLTHSTDFRPVLLQFSRVQLRFRSVIVSYGIRSRTNVDFATSNTQAHDSCHCLPAATTVVVCSVFCTQDI